MAQPKDAGHGGSSGGGGDDQTGRRTRRRRRTVLNLGMPFLRMDDFVNQSEDIVALGYRVLQKTVEEIQNGYQEAKEFNRKQEEYERKQKAFEKGKGPRPVPPTIPWEQMVERAQSFQNMALEAVRDGSEIIFDSIKSATKSTKGLARTWEKSRDDIDTSPVLAGPVFEDPVTIKANVGERPAPVVLPIRHRGLTRLRIQAVVDPKPREIPRPEKGKPEEFGGMLEVSFEPATDMGEYDDITSLLTVTVGTIPSTQKPALYEGFIRALNFELLIARLRIRVLKPYETRVRRAGVPESSDEDSYNQAQ